MKRKEGKHYVRPKFLRYFNIQILLDLERFIKLRRESFVLLWTLPEVEIFKVVLKPNIRIGRRMVAHCNTGVKITSLIGLHRFVLPLSMFMIAKSCIEILNLRISF